MRERAELIAGLRGELVGPGRHHGEPHEARFAGKIFEDEQEWRSGPLAWRWKQDEPQEEVLYFSGESPHRKYGAGLLHPVEAVPAPGQDTDHLSAVIDTLGHEPGEVAPDDGEPDDPVTATGDDSFDPDMTGDEFEVNGTDLRHPSSIGVSFCASLEDEGRVIVGLPRGRRFSWQKQDDPEFSLNGRYEACQRTRSGEQRDGRPMWRRTPAVLPDTQVTFPVDVLDHGKVCRSDVTMPEGSPVTLRIELFPRRLPGDADGWLLTVVLRNTSDPGTDRRKHQEATLYQTCFEVRVEGGRLERYPESERPFDQLDEDERSLALLYRDSACWGTGHGCAAGWEAPPGERPAMVFADVMPAVELPSMTPEVNGRDGSPVKLSMRALYGMTGDPEDPAWRTLEELSLSYASWIEDREAEIEEIRPRGLEQVARSNLDRCRDCLERIDRGIALLQEDPIVLTAFRLANLSMLLQQIATKQLTARPLVWSGQARRVVPDGEHRSPWSVFKDGTEDGKLGQWRAFQVAFLLMSLEGVAREESTDHDTVDLIWFPTGGGKTEAYLGVMAFLMFHERLRPVVDGEPRRDGTNIIMRYTLRMLTTQQFQRAASMICAMEFIRRNPPEGVGEIPGHRFSVGLWIGDEGSPNTVRRAEQRLRDYSRDGRKGNPLVLTECPWCRSMIGRFDGKTPRGIRANAFDLMRLQGVKSHEREPLLCCPDAGCAFGKERHEHWLPVEVIDERIYRNPPPSLVISTADKLAMIAYRPDAGILFGREASGTEVIQVNRPPRLIVQDELHLISGPLGTMYAFYEGIVERLCSTVTAEGTVRPKIIASTATIRGADDQVKALYGRESTRLFPEPGISMGDSFFGRYARVDGDLDHGRLYLGIHASNHGSVLTTQVRTFAAALYQPHLLDPDSRDAWWTLLCFYNSLRELGGARTLFDSDIRSRLKFLFNREGHGRDDRRNLRGVEELTSRLSQPQIVGMMERLSRKLDAGDWNAIDACLASNIIEVGVDIDRLSLMAVVGQPKTTAQYIQVTGRVGRRWWERPGLILTIYNTSKSRDRSHLEQFHSYHRRLYERVEPTSATPFATSAIRRALPGALIAWTRQCLRIDSPGNREAHRKALEDGHSLLVERCRQVMEPAVQERALDELVRVKDELWTKWGRNPQKWEHFPPSVDGEYLMLWPGQFATAAQRSRGVVVPSSMRQVDGSAELRILDYESAISS